MSLFERANRNTATSVMSVNAAPFVPRMSPTAAPFVPRSFRAKVSAIGKPATLSASAQEFVPRCFNTMPEEDHWIEYENPVTEVCRMLNMMTDSPEEFDILVASLFDLLSRYVHDLTVMTDIVEEVFHRMLLEPSFRCSGAKICRYMIDDQSTGNFGQLFLTKCVSHYNMLTTNGADSDESITSLTSFAVLIADVINNDTGSMMSELLQVLKELMQILLAQGTDDALICVANVLTLTCGVFYERGIDVDDVLSMVMNFVQNPVTSKYLQDLLKNALPESWQTVNPLSRSRASNYGIDLEQNHYGQFMLDDEKDVINRINRLSCLDDIDSNKVETADNGADDGEMDPEIEAAFDQFLREVDESIVSPTVNNYNYIPELSNVQAQQLHSPDSASLGFGSHRRLLSTDTRPSLMFTCYSNADAVNSMPYFEGHLAEGSPQFSLSPTSLGLSPASLYFSGPGSRQFGINPYATSPDSATMFPVPVAAAPWSMIDGAQYPFSAPPGAQCTTNRGMEAEQESIPFTDNTYDDRHGFLFYNNLQLTANGCGPQSLWN